MNQKREPGRFGCYEFGLKPEEEERAARLHAESIIIDMQFDGPCGYRSFTPEMEARLQRDFETHHSTFKALIAALREPVRLAILGEFPEYKECWDATGITAASRPLIFGTYEVLCDFASFHTSEFDRLPWMIKALTAADIRNAKQQGKHAGFFYCQPLVPISQDLRLLDQAYDFGLRMLQLTYNRLDFVGAGCTERADPGLSDFGLKLVARLNELRIIVDTSHCGPRTTLDACRFSKAPVLACHTSARGVFDHPRGKSDEEIRAIADTGGLIGVYAVPFFLAAGGQASIDAMLDHMEYIADLVGWEHVGIGADWPMQMPNQLLEVVLRNLLVELGFRPDDVSNMSARNLDGFDDYRDFPNITRGLVKRGLSDSEIKGVLGENFLRLFERVCG